MEKVLKEKFFCKKTTKQKSTEVPFAKDARNEVLLRLLVKMEV